MRTGGESRFAAWSWVLIAAVAVAELVGHAWIEASVPTEGSWEAASSFVREGFAPGDRIVATPRWADPLVRTHLGDLLTLETASTDDRLHAGNLWELSIRDAQSRGDSPALEQQFGDVRVRRWAPLDETPAFDFVEEIERAEVEYDTPKGARACAWMRAPVGTGGLGHGPLPPRERFVCDARRPWLWVGPTVMADLDHKPRRCIWQHPSGTDPVRTKWSEVVLGDELVFFGGLDYNNARRASENPVRLAVFIDEELAGEMRVRGRDGWTRLEIDTRRWRETPHDVRIETTAPVPHARTFCWSGVARDTGGER